VLPQLSEPPQPSGGLPQLAPSAAHVVLVHPHWYGVPPPPQVWGAVHAPPQLRVPPQPSGGLPQLAPSAAHVVLTHAPMPHWFGLPFPVPDPPPQTSGAWHVPQSSMLPHPSDSVPHVAPRAAQVVGVQPHTFGTPPPPHVSTAPHAFGSHVITVPHAFVSVPQSSGAGQELKSGAQPHTFGVPPPPHVCGAAHGGPQLI
jgi:hypothetical protein